MKTNQDEMNTNKKIILSFVFSTAISLIALVVAIIVFLTT